MSFDLAGCIEIITVATTRIWPMLTQSPTPQMFYFTFVGLNPIVTSFWLMCILIAVQLFLSIATRSISWNDRAWPIIPLAHAVVYVVHPIVSSNPDAPPALDARLCIMFALVAIWSVRLTVHAVLRGVYIPGAVDYRYHWIRANVLKSNLSFLLFYVCFICFSLTLLMSLTTAPMYFAWVSRNRVHLSLTDIIASVGMLFGIFIETVADRQQQNFQAVKYNLRGHSRTEKSYPAHLRHLESDVADGFLQSGLFAHCRHPNFFAEIVIWFSFYFFSIGAGGHLLNWTLLGPSLYLLLFQGSTAVTERISASKYPKYPHYQQHVYRLLFNPFPHRQTLPQKPLPKKE